MTYICKQMDYTKIKEQVETDQLSNLETNNMK